MRTVALAALMTMVLSALLAPPARAHGLLVSRPATPTREPIPARPVHLVSHRVEAKVDGPVADVTIEQVFRNTSAARLEGTYLFPLPEGATVAKFAMTMGDKMVEGEVMDAARARAIYEGIVRRQRDPGLLEYVGRGLFRARVFPIEPKSDLTIRLSFQQVLPEDSGTLEFRYPLATDRLHGEPVAETVITVEVKSDTDVKAVYSPSHDVAVVRRSEKKVHASFEQGGARQSRDFLLYIGKSEERVGLSMLSHKAAGEDGTFLAVLAPRVDPGEGDAVPKDVIFVIDTSGSMQDDGKIDQAKRALAFGIRLLRPQDRFEIVAFSGEVRCFRERLVKADPAVVVAAMSWIGELRATGGTFIEDALRTALAVADPERLSQVVFITDGKPTVGRRNTEWLVDMVTRSNPAKARMFTFGVGFDLEVNLLDEIAEATRGARDYVMPKDELEIVTSRFFRKVVEPVLTDLTIDLGGDASSVYPKLSALPDLFAGGQLVLMGRYAESGKRTIRLRGRVGEREIEYVFEADLSGKERASYLPRLWAHRKVAFLLDEIRLHGEEKELVDEVKRLAIRHAIVTPYTSNLVVEEEELEGRPLASANPLFVSPPTTASPPPRSSGGGYSSGHGGQFRGPGDRVPPGLREPTDPTPPPPPPPSGPPTTPTPTTPRTPSAVAPAPSVSKRLAEEKARSTETGGSSVRVVEGKTFRKDAEGRWIDTAWDEKKETVKVEAFSDAWTALLAKGDKVKKYLALGEKVVFVLDDVVYEITP